MYHVKSQAKDFETGFCCSNKRCLESHSLLFPTVRSGYYYLFLFEIFSVSFVECFLFLLKLISFFFFFKFSVAVAFKIYDMDKDGFISNGELFQVLKMMVGSNLKDSQLQQIVDKTIFNADKDGDGKISYEEFCTVS